MMVTVELAPSDALDRLAIAAVKTLKISGARQAVIRAEWSRYAVACRPLLKTMAVLKLYADLVDLHRQTFELLERAVPHALNGGMSMEDHHAAIRLNRDRVKLKRDIDAALGHAESEIKSYYDQEGICSSRSS